MWITTIWQKKQSTRKINFLWFSTRSLYCKTCPGRTASSTASTSSCHTSIPFKLFTDALDEVKNMMANQTKDFSKQKTEMNNVIDRLTSQVTGLRSVVRDQAGEIRRVSSPPSFRVPSAINRARSRTPLRNRGRR